MKKDPVVDSPMVVAFLAVWSIFNLAKDRYTGKPLYEALS